MFPRTDAELVALSEQSLDQVRRPGLIPDAMGEDGFKNRTPNFQRFIDREAVASALQGLVTQPLLKMIIAAKESDGRAARCRC
jgi:hypothetical protein